MPSQPRPPGLLFPWYVSLILLAASPFLLAYDYYYVRKHSNVRRNRRHGT